jgi:death-on-curing protein
MEPEWLERGVVDTFHFEQIREHGGAHGVRDEGLLESALYRAQQLWEYGDPKPDICAMAAAYAYGIAKNHPYFDGNKRTAAIACEVFLLLNGYEFTVGEVEKYPYFYGLAAGEFSEQEFLDWLRLNTRPSE